MNKEFEREALLYGEAAMEKLKNARVALFGVGGVGSYAAEALARSGIGHILLVDCDTVSVSNINRQLCALHSTVGHFKVDVVASRLLDINPELEVVTRRDFVLPDNIDSFDFASFDYVIDAIDTVSAKIAIAEVCTSLGVPLISSMGTGNKQDPTALKVTDISKTNTCPLARVMRRELKKRGISHLRVVYSEEEAMTPLERIITEGGKVVPGSLAFVPSVAGLITAAEAVKQIIAEKDRENG
ncbi:MAG: tRNA threonylcarbamoyladenosine dehydratase [Clostridia bacterium]|nr:tRNA threonylcarbamoyladenosine dehydratase [Clostridia bacterium]